MARISVANRSPSCAGVNDAISVIKFIRVEETAVCTVWEQLAA